VLFNKLFSSIALSNENSEYEIFGSEIPFEIDLSKLNIKFDDKNISLQGVIDRIDILELDGVKYADIYDFKTGYKEISINKVLEGLDYQLILYALALLNTKLNFNNTKVSGIYYYLIEDRFSQDGEIEERLKNLLIGELEAIQKHNNEKIKPRSGNYIASDVFELLKEKMLSNLENSINNIIEGKMDPSPANDGNLFCEFCGYSSICRFEKDKSKDKIRVFAQSGQGKTNKMIIESLESQVKKHGD
jgi:ATP-dependent helicase/nuclease subunit B